MAQLQLSNISKTYGTTEVLKGIDLQVDHGELVVLVGPSGCGKSTLLRMLCGLEPITAGELRIDGELVNHLPPAQRGVAMVFQSYALYPHMTVYQNMAFGLKLHGADRVERERRILQAAQALHIEHLLKRRPRELSGGQRQRVALGRAIVRDPKVFLFDEPLSNLDAALRGQTRVEIANLHRSLGATTIYVTHDQIEAMTLADRVVVLRDGMIEQVGSPLDLYDRPANQFVAQFIGTPQMNVVSATTLPVLTRIAGPRLPADGSVGVRPEYVKVVGSGAGIPGTVELVEALGSDTLIHVKVASDVHLIARQSERTSLKLGDAVGVEIDQSALLYFHQQGRALREMQQAA